MRIKLKNLQRFKLVQPGDVIHLENPRPRVVKIEFNVETDTRLDIIYGDGKGKPLDPTFMCVIRPDGPQIVEFHAEGECQVLASSEGEVWWATDDGDTINHQITTESFTDIYQDMDVTPQMEIVAYKEALRREQRLREQAEMVARRALRQQEAETPHDPKTGEVHEPDTGGDDEPAEGEGAAV